MTACAFAGVRSDLVVLVGTAVDIAFSHAWKKLSAGNRRARLAGPPSRYGGPTVKPMANYFNENVSPVVNRWTRGVASSRWTKNVR